VVHVAEGASQIVCELGQRPISEDVQVRTGRAHGYREATHPMYRSGIHPLYHGVKRDSKAPGVARHSQARRPEPRKLRWTRVEVEALPRIGPQDVVWHDDRGAEGDDPDCRRRAFEVPPQIAQGGCPPEPAAGKSTDARAEELSFRDVHEKNDEVIANGW